MDIQQKKKNLDFIETASAVLGVGSSLYMLNAARTGDFERAMAAGGATVVGMGILGVLIYKTETSIYGFSPTFQRK